MPTIVTLAAAKPDCPRFVMRSFLAQGMRSIAHDHRRRQAQEDLWRSHAAQSAAATDPAGSLAARQALGAIFTLFAADVAVLRIIEGLAYGRSAAEVRTRHGLSEVEYENARKRLRRALLRLE